MSISSRSSELMLAEVVCSFLLEIPKSQAGSSPGTVGCSCPGTNAAARLRAEDAWGSPTESAWLRSEAFALHGVHKLSFGSCFN